MEYEENGIKKEREYDRHNIPLHLRDCEDPDNYRCYCRVCRARITYAHRLKNQEEKEYFLQGFKTQYKKKNVKWKNRKNKGIIKVGKLSILPTDEANQSSKIDE